MAGQVELADDLRPQQRHDVRTHGELEARKHFFRHGGAAENVPPLEDEHFAASSSEVRRVDEPVMTAADDDDVVFHNAEC